MFAQHVRPRSSIRWSFLFLVLFPVVGCQPATDEATPATPDLAGTWRAVLSSPGGELPFGLAFSQEGTGWTAVAINGDEEVEFSRVVVEGASVDLYFDGYDSRIEAEMADGILQGTWTRTSAGGTLTQLPFTASPGPAPRFVPYAEVDAETSDSVAGHWAVEFTDEDGAEPARAEFEQEGTRVVGTFLTPTGDYRFLQGSYEGGRLRLSTFDGAHAFLFDARATADGLAGDFWSRDTYHATWVARPLADGETVLPDSWDLVQAKAAPFRFTFDGLDGRSVAHTDERFQGKALLVNIFGSWCPNCNDEAPLLAQWHREYRDQGLEVVGLAYEFTGDRERDAELVRRFRDRHGIEYPLLLAGTSDKEAAAATLPDLPRVVAFPTTVFVGRDGNVRRVHSGFSGPGTGEHYDELVAKMVSEIEQLLSEPVPQA